MKAKIWYCKTSKLMFSNTWKSPNYQQRNRGVQQTHWMDWHMSFWDFKNCSPNSKRSHILLSAIIQLSSILTSNIVMKFGLKLKLKHWCCHIPFFLYQNKSFHVSKVNVWFSKKISSTSIYQYTLFYKQRISSTQPQCCLTF